MTEQTPDPAAGASRWEAPAAGSLRPASDLAAASEQLLAGGSRQLDSAALRDALLDLHDFWLTTKATEIGVTATSGFAIVATGGLPSSLAAKQATDAIPIVFTLGSDPVKFGLVSSLNRPNGNVTGVTLFAYLLDAKRVELMHELVPGASVFALLVNPNSPSQAEAQYADVEAAVRKFGQQLVILKAGTDSEIDSAIAGVADGDRPPGETANQGTSYRRLAAALEGGRGIPERLL